ncbi:MAG: flavodoxin FldA [Methanosarcinaceae archaeon]|nr:flavodoxin FldA [Methanosarcinaceae archaeon]
MKKTAIFFGSTTGTTEDVANRLAKMISADVYNVKDNPADKFPEYDVLILGTSTWGIGELQDDWYDFLPNLEKADLSNKKVAIFGVGDSMGYPDSFVDAMRILYDIVVEKGCEIVGMTKTDGYDFDFSTSVLNDRFVGLAIDEDNENSMTEERLTNWVEQLKAELK